MPVYEHEVNSILRFIEQERKHNRELEHKAVELVRLNRQLQVEINERKQAQTALEHVSRQNQLILEFRRTGFVTPYGTFVLQVGVMKKLGLWTKLIVQIICLI